MLFFRSDVFLLRVYFPYSNRHGRLRLDDSRLYLTNPVLAIIGTDEEKLSWVMIKATRIP